jgi:hypothetical protein
MMFSGSSERLRKRRSFWRRNSPRCSYLWEQVIEEDLRGEDGRRATEIMRGINRRTPRHADQKPKGKGETVEEIAALLKRVHRARNRLSHLFYQATQLAQKLGRGPCADDAGP